MSSHEQSITLQERFRGCLLAGAAGDALGAPVEFLTFRDIEHRFGISGILDYVEAYGRLGAITDDTQMTLFTAEGLLRSWVYVSRGGLEKTWIDFMHESYQRWLRTQDPALPLLPGDATSGWLASHKDLYHQRAPGNTCLSAMYAAIPGRAENNSKGCGGVMRAAPVGLWFSHQPDLKAVFEAGAEMAAITHGHPTGYLTAAVFAALIAQLIHGKSIREALRWTKTELLQHKGHAETLHSIEAAEHVARSTNLAAHNAIEKLGGGWVAEEALAIAVYCALKAGGLEEGVVMAVNHGGDSDSTGSMVGNLLGCIYGAQQIPSRWLDSLEMRDLVTQVADDLQSATNPALHPSLVQRYGGEL